jgi:hypothetical protein
VTSDKPGSHIFAIADFCSRKCPAGSCSRKFRPTIVMAAPSMRAKILLGTSLACSTERKRTHNFRGKHAHTGSWIPCRPGRMAPRMVNPQTGHRDLTSPCYASCGPLLHDAALEGGDLDAYLTTVAAAEVVSQATDGAAVDARDCCDCIQVVQLQESCVVDVWAGVRMMLKRFSGGGRTIDGRRRRSCTVIARVLADTGCSGVRMVVFQQW